jgi:hypothetical protein
MGTINPKLTSTINNHLINPKHDQINHKSAQLTTIFKPIDQQNVQSRRFQQNSVRGRTV